MSTRRKVTAQQKRDIKTQASKTRATRAADLYRPVTNSGFVLAELDSMLRGRKSLQSTLVNDIEIDLCREFELLKRVSRIGSSEIMGRALEILNSTPNDEGYIIKPRGVKAVTFSGFAAHSVLHAVIMWPGPESHQRVQQDLDTIEKIYEMPDSNFFAGITVAACFSGDQAEAVAHTLNNQAKRLQQIGLVAGPIASRAPQYL